MNRIFNYTLDPCGPVYITAGDGGNIEKVDIDHADDPGKCPSPGDNRPEFGSVCHLNFTSGPAKGKFCWDRQPEWSAFRESSFGHGILEVTHFTPNVFCTICFNNGAYILCPLSCCFLLLFFISHICVQVPNSTYALWTWHRNQDAYGENSVGDQIYIVRQPCKCLLQPSSASLSNW
jgi:acid phosphatase type 7